MRSGLPPLLPLNAALIVIDLQRAIDHPSWGIRNNPQAEANVARLLAHWRATERPIYHIRHDSREPASHYRPGQPGHEFKPQTAPLPGETVLGKHTTNACEHRPRRAAPAQRAIPVAVRRRHHE